MFFLDWIGINPQETISYFSFYILKGTIAYITLYLLMLITSERIEILTTNFDHNNGGSPTQILTPEIQTIHIDQIIKEALMNGNDIKESCNANSIISTLV